MGGKQPQTSSPSPPPSLAIAATLSVSSFISPSHPPPSGLGGSLSPLPPPSLAIVAPLSGLLLHQPLSSSSLGFRVAIVAFAAPSLLFFPRSLPSPSTPLSSIATPLSGHRRPLFGLLLHRPLSSSSLEFRGPSSPSPRPLSGILLHRPLSSSSLRFRGATAFAIPSLLLLSRLLSPPSTPSSIAATALYSSFLGRHRHPLFLPQSPSSTHPSSVAATALSSSSFLCRGRRPLLLPRPSPSLAPYLWPF